MARPRRKEHPTQITIPPTPERMAKAEGFIHASKDGPFTVRDAPLERLHGSKRLTDAQYNAATKFRHHWHNAGLAERFAVPTPIVAMNFAATVVSFATVWMYTR